LIFLLHILSWWQWHVISECGTKCTCNVCHKGRADYFIQNFLSPFHCLPHKKSSYQQNSIFVLFRHFTYFVILQGTNASNRTSMKFPIFLWRCGSSVCDSFTTRPQKSCCTFGRSKHKETMHEISYLFVCCKGSLAGEDYGWIQLAQYRDRWWALVNTMMNLQVLAQLVSLLVGTEEMPHQWKESVVVRIYKKGNRQNCIVIIKAYYCCQLHKKLYKKNSCFWANSVCRWKYWGSPVWVFM
jgi:hypothetical protein